MIMRKHFLIQFLFCVLLVVVYNNLPAQTPDDKIKKEINEALDLWNAACKNADLEQVMSMFDNSDNIMVIGSDKGEVFKGKVEVRKWLRDLFAFAGFSWEMDRIDIDYHDKTAWAFVEGLMIVTIHNGETLTKPYRFTAVLVKKKNGWKWRLFDGSVPKKE
jgi:ketosteroid isomerase-like protein